MIVCRVTVDAGVTTDMAGNLNTAASQVLKYRPPSQAVAAVSNTGNAVIGASVAASLVTGLLAGNPPGSLPFMLAVRLCFTASKR